MLNSKTLQLFRLNQNQVPNLNPNLNLSLNQNQNLSLNQNLTQMLRLLAVANTKLLP